MALMASASDHRHRHHRAAKSSPPADPETPSLSKVPAEKSSARAGLHGFTFSWGAHRRLRCSKDGAPVYDSTSPSPSPPQQPHTPSPDKEKSKPSPQDPSPGCSSRPQRPRRNLRPPSYAYAHPATLRSGVAGPALKSPSAPPPPEARKRKRGFAVALTKEEIARDFTAIRRCGRPPSRARGKKLKKEVQDKIIDSLCPGSTLDKVDLANYKIGER